MPTYGINGTTLNIQNLQLKFKLASEWQANDALLAGEVGVEKDTHKFKVGDGTTTWGELPYSADPNVQTLVDALTARVATAEGNITTMQGEITALQGKDTEHESRMTTIESKDTAQDGRLDALEGITTLSANPFSE